MKNIFFWLVFVGWSAAAQNLYLNISGESVAETKTIDSIRYNLIFDNAKAVIDEASRFSEQLLQIGYLENELLKKNKVNDSTFSYKFRLGKKTELIKIYINADARLKSLLDLNVKNDTMVFPYRETEAFLNQNMGKLEKKGFALAKLQLINVRKKNNYLEATLQLTLEKQRHLDDIIVNGYAKFPEGHKYNIKKLYRNKIFNKENLKNIYDDFGKFRFVKQVKYPEILFASDSTKVYVYLEKTKANSFDGFVGFSNNEKNKLIFSGYVDLTLNNVLNTGENFTLYWKSAGNNQKTFNASIELPYIFKSPFGLKAQLNIFKQDSTFQNTGTAIDLGYYFKFNTRAYLGYQATESSDIQNLNSSGISDFKNTFLTSHFTFVNYRPENELFPEKTKIKAGFGFGSRNSKLQRNNQVFLDIEMLHNIYFNDKNSFYIRSQNYYLKSDTYVINELYRFGGINSIRGFNENSLQANLFTSILTEYRYIIVPGIYVHSIIDYGYFTDKTSNSNGSLLGLGFGFGLLTKNGLFNIVYANGSTKNQAVKVSNSIVHVSFKTNF